MEVEVEKELVRVEELVRVDEGVAGPEVDRGHLAGPHGGVHQGARPVQHHRLLDAVGEGESLLLDAGLEV